MDRIMKKRLRDFGHPVVRFCVFYWKTMPGLASSGFFSEKNDVINNLTDLRKIGQFTFFR